MTSTSPHDPFDILIIGGGIIGLSTAWHLQKQGHKIAVIDKGEIGSGSSSGNAGMIVPSHFIPLAAPGVIQQGLGWMLNRDSPFYIKPRADLDLIRWLWNFARSATAVHVERSMPLLLEMHLQSLAIFEEMAHDDQLSFGLKQDGLLMLYRTDEGAHECRDLVEAAQQLNLAAEMLSPAEVSAKLAPLELDISGGTWLPRDAHLNPRQLVTALHQSLRTAGVTFFTGEEVTEFTQQNGRITQLQLTNRVISGREVVLATGAWSSGLARQLNLNVPIQAAKGYSFMVPRLTGKLNIPLLLADAKVALTPLADGLRFAGTLEITGIDLSINQRRVQAIRNAPRQYIPEFELSEQEQTTPEIWAGMRPLSPDGLPYIGRAPHLKNLTIATGHAMMGISLAPITGRLVSEIINGQAPSINLTHLAPNRF